MVTIKISNRVVSVQLHSIIRCTLKKVTAKTPIVLSGHYDMNAGFKTAKVGDAVQVNIGYASPNDQYCFRITAFDVVFATLL